MKKSRVLALLLAAVLLLAGCAKGSDEQLNTAQIEETETVEDPEEVPAAERAASFHRPEAEGRTLGDQPMAV